MQALALAFSPRFIALTLCFMLTVVLIAAIGASIAPRWEWFQLVGVALFGGLTLLGVHDLLQSRHAVLRNYPISAHLRFLLEELRPEMRQYFFESETDGLPFSRTQRAIVYQRAKMALDKRPFGTQLDVYAQGYEWLRHSIAPQPGATEHVPRRRSAGPDCRQPYSASVFNISAMSFGSLSANAIRALNSGAKLGGFAHDTGEGGYSPYHREGGGDIIWEIGSGYFGCRTPGRRVRSRQVRRRRRQSADQDDRDQAEPGRQARPRRRAAGGQGDAEIAAIRGVDDGQGLHLARRATARSRPRSK